MKKRQRELELDLMQDVKNLATQMQIDIKRLVLTLRLNQDNIESCQKFVDNN